MCGIAGIYNGRLDPTQRLKSLEGMVTRIGYRGPDRLGCFADDSAAIGTARLSIVDSHGGDQPLTDVSRRYVIAFNGELYNYKILARELAAGGYEFRTQSDTEVALAAWIVWGKAALPRFVGAFAFAIYDRISRELVLARDIFGERPLYYKRWLGGLVFASEMKCFLECEETSLAWDFRQLAAIYRTWVPIGEYTAFEGIQQILPGQILLATDESVRLDTYARLSLKSSTYLGGECEAREQIRASVNESVRTRLQGDCEVGAYLSGGLDSAILVHVAATHASTPLKTFSVGFDDATLDESEAQHAVAASVGSIHTPLQIGDKDIVEAFPQALAHAEVPVFRSAFVPMYLLSDHARKSGVKVVLSGEGADEVFLGYDIFKETELREQWIRLDEPARRMRLSALYPYLSHFNQDNQTSLYAYFDRFTRTEGDDQLFSHQLRFQTGVLATRLLPGAPSGLSPLHQSIAQAGSEFDELDSVERAQWLEFKTLLAGYLLSTQGDRMTAAHGVESRCPYLDPALLSLATRVNRRFGDGVQEKYILRRAFEDELPPAVLNRRKQPFRAPDAVSFLRCQPDYLEMVRSETELRKVGIFNTGFCSSLVSRLCRKPIGQITPAENQAFMFLLSTAMLDYQFRRGGMRLYIANKPIELVDERSKTVSGAA